MSNNVVSSPYTVTILDADKDEDCLLYKGMRIISLVNAPGVFDETFEGVNSRTDEQWRDSLSQEATSIIWLDKKPVGIARLTNDWVDASWYRIGSVWVHPVHRGTEAATVLVEDVVRQAVVAGSKRQERESVDAPGILLSVSKENPRAAAFYKKLGFVDDPEWPVSGEPWIVMKRPF